LVQFGSNDILESPFLSVKKYIYGGKITGNSNIYVFNKKNGERKYKNRLNTANVGLSHFLLFRRKL